MSAQDWAGFILTLTSIGGVTLGAIRWYIKVQVQPMQDQIQSLKVVIDEVRAETKTNGGSSMRDEIKFIKKDNEDARVVRQEQKEKLDHMYDILLEYIASNKK